MRRIPKGEQKVTNLSLKELESSVKTNALKRKQIIERFESKTRQSNLQKGRVRPKHPTEAKILSMFTKK